MARMAQLENGSKIRVVSCIFLSPNLTEEYGCKYIFFRFDDILCVENI